MTVDRSFIWNYYKNDSYIDSKNIYDIVTKFQSDAYIVHNIFAEKGFIDPFDRHVTFLLNAVSFETEQAFNKTIDLYLDSAKGEVEEDKLTAILFVTLGI